MQAEVTEHHHREAQGHDAEDRHRLLPIMA
jgi:hypothetical protein